MVKQYVTSLALSVSVISGYLGFIATGLLDPLNSVIIWEYTIPQLIFLLLFMSLPAVLVGELILGRIKPEDALPMLQESMQEAVGVSQKEVGRFTEDVAAKLKQSVGINALEARADPKRARQGITQLPYPSPEVLWSELQANFRPLLARQGVFQVSASAIEVPEIPDEELEIIPGSPASAKALTRASEAAASKRKKILIWAIVIIAISVAVWLLSMYFLPKGGA